MCERAWEPIVRVGTIDVEREIDLFASRSEAQRRFVAYSWLGVHFDWNEDEAEFHIAHPQSIVVAKL